MKSLPHPRFLLFLAVSILVAVLGSTILAAERAFLLGFDAGVIAFLASSVRLWREDHPGSINAQAVRDDGGRVLLPIASAFVLVAVLIAVGVMVSRKSSPNVQDFVWVATSLSLAWMFINVIFAYHYAHLFYEAQRHKGAGGLNFPGEDSPTFADFCYFSLVIGMTCQVSDVVIESHSMRRVGTVHGLLAFFFNLGVLALTINVLSGVLQSSNG